MTGNKSFSKLSATLLIMVSIFSALPMGSVSANGGSTLIGFEDFDVSGRYRAVDTYAEAAGARGVALSKHKRLLNGTYALS